MRPISLAFAVAAISLLVSGPASAAGDPAAGKKVFRKCAVCHSLEPGKKKVGPSLHRVVGRTPGTTPGFKYSEAMKSYGAGGAVWTPETLDTFLAAPRKLVNGTRMGFPGLKSEEQRADVIAYLKAVAEK